jgi:hypothetical protein
MAFHSDKTATFVTPVQPDQPPSGTAAWLREMARGSNSVNGGLVAEQQARIAGDNFLQSEIDALTGGTGVVGPPGPPGPTGPSGPPGATGPQGPNIVTADTPPASPAIGSGWWDSVGGQLYIWFNDGTSSQWVPSANQPGPPGPAGPIGAASTVPGPPGATGPSGAPGATGATGPAGPTGATGAAGSANMSGMVAGQIPIAASATSVTSSAMAWDAVNNRLGIGPATPLAKLHVTDADNPTIGLWAGVTKGVRIGASSGGGSIDGVDNTGVGSFQPLAIGGSQVSFWPAGAEAMRITSGGNVGIATTAPGEKLTVNGGVRITGLITGAAAASFGAIDYYAAGNVFRLLAYGPNTSTTGGFSFTGLSSDGTSAATSPLTMVGNTVGVGNTSPGTAGGLLVGNPTGGAKGGGTINANTVYGNNVVLTSDADLKTDIEPLTQALPLVSAIEPKSFRWKELEDPDAQPPDFTDKINRGFLARDVFETMGGDVTGVDLGGMVAVLWQAVRELTDRVAELEGDKPFHA